ncbi:MAG TPA: ATP-binding protein [Terriglobales bacterium]|jgi:two-component system sensor histidine kinase PilS (NtrC family)|nr:ATP-binding protein [Terriglobales bacterium]
MQSMFDERLWLAWLAKVRIIILTLLFGIELAIARLTPNPFPLRLFIHIVLLWYTISIFYLLLLSFWEEQRVQALLQVVTDLVLVTMVVYATGGVDSSLNFLYPLVIIVACILLPRAWAYLTGALAFILYVAVLELTYFEVIPSYSTTHPGLGALQAIIFVNLFGYLAVAYLAGLLAAKLRQVDVKLKHTSGALEDLQALHENIIQSISAGLITTGLDGYITLVNTAAQRLFERSEADVLGQPVGQLFLDRLPEVSEERAHGEVRFVAPGGFCKTFRVMATTLAVPGRNTIGYVYTFDDLTEIRRLERDLRIQDRLAAVGRLAAAIAHEIRNPLTSIAGSVSMLSGIADLSDEHRQLLQIVTRESERLNGIITDFLAYSRGKQYQFASVDLLPLLEDTLTLLENRLVTENTGIRIERNYAYKQALTMADGNKIKQVFWNFCENAVRAMSSGGVLKVSLEQVGDDWQINFADTGPGMSRQLVEKIFEPFQSQFEGGTGLGLAIVYQIVQAHEGKVWARSKLGEGSVFVLRLRRASVAEKMTPPQAAATLQLQARSAQEISVAAGIGGRAHG